LVSQNYLTRTQVARWGCRRARRASSRSPRCCLIVPARARGHEPPAARGRRPARSGL